MNHIQKLTIVWLFIGSFGAPTLSFAKPAWMPKRTCKEAWQKLANAEYDYSRDSQLNNDGNIGYAAYAERVRRKDCVKPWTLLVYMAADNDLTPYALMDLYEMEAGFLSLGPPKVGSSIRSDLIVQVDTNLSRKIRRLHMFQTPEPYNPKITIEDFESVGERNIRSPIVQLIDESNQQDPARDLENFLKWGIREYPAEHYMVIVWGHGQGWTAHEISASQKVESRFLSGDIIPAPLGQMAILDQAPSGAVDQFKGRAFGGLAFDDSEKTFLSIPQLASIFARVSKSELGGAPIDVYASDACLMQMFEVAYEMSKNTRYLVGSTQIQNFLGLPYRRIMTEINTGLFGEKSKPDSKDEAYLMAKMIPKVFQSSMKPQGLQGRINKSAIKTITMSSINSSELRNHLAKSLINLSKAITNYIKENPDRAFDIQFAMQQAPSFQGGAQELGAFLTLLSNVLSAESLITAFTPAAQRLRDTIHGTAATLGARQALHQSVVAFALGTNYSNLEQQYYLLGLRAFSIWLPKSHEEYLARIDNFRESSFYNIKNESQSWSTWIDLIYAN